MFEPDFLFPAFPARLSSLPEATSLRYFNPPGFSLMILSTVWRCSSTHFCSFQPLNIANCSHWAGSRLGKDCLKPQVWALPGRPALLSWFYVWFGASPRNLTGISHSISRPACLPYAHFLWPPKMQNTHNALQRPSAGFTFGLAPHSPTPRNLTGISHSITISRPACLPLSTRPGHACCLLPFAHFLRPTKMQNTHNGYNAFNLCPWFGQSRISLDNVILSLDNVMTFLISSPILDNVAWFRLSTPDYGQFCTFSYISQNIMDNSVPFV